MDNSTICKDLETTIDFRLNLASQCRCLQLFLSIAGVSALLCFKLSSAITFGYTDQ